ncbi:hypothetical protein CCACVL1_12992 [Corchorus capsularis]|uniref:F-box domain-containing protein n=1 Tax=Corchorus capsularis TaxID=210143 RepID=A0A1R3ICV7_COCAP|nr:hypothetical protein CCACVL1_12992 [Corchorus capsularis]
MEEETYNSITSRKNPPKRWEDLDTNILKGILSRIPPDNLFWEISCVCHAWQSVAWDFLFWNHNVLDLKFVMTALSDSPYAEPTNLLELYSRRDFPGKYPSPREYHQMAAKLTMLLKHIMEGNDPYGHSLWDWRQSIHTIVIPFDLELSDDHLLYIAERYIA